MPDPTLLLQPIAGLFLLTFIVWLFMYYKRLSYIHHHKINAQALMKPEDVNALLPDEVNLASNNLKNLFEMPVIFYALCGFLMVCHQVDIVDVILAWAFLLCRVLHSVIHCQKDHSTVLRFGVYVVSSVVLWVMVLKFCWWVFLG